MHGMSWQDDRTAREKRVLEEIGSGTGTAWNHYRMGFERELAPRMLVSLIAVVFIFCLQCACVYALRLCGYLMFSVLKCCKILSQSSYWLNLEIKHLISEKIRGSITISPNFCVMCSEFKTNSHLFLHCDVTWQNWNRLFGLFNKKWACPADLDLFLAIAFNGFRSNNEQKYFGKVLFLQACGVYGLNGMQEFLTQSFSHQIFFGKELFS